MSKKLFDKDCLPGLSTTSLIHGKTSGSINLNNLKYQWAYNLWEVMLNNTWFPKEVDMTSDPLDYKKLLPSEKSAYDKALSQLIFMDGIQKDNTPDNVNPWITAPEINMCLDRQAFEEALHVQSYAVMVDSISSNTEEIYEMWRKDKNLANKNEFILDIYEKYGATAENDDEAKIYMIVANQCLEGIYFYSGFATLYSLARSGKMKNSAAMIKFIQRDEVTHLILFSNIYKDIKKEYPHLFTDKVKANIRQMLIDAAEIEISWGKYITKDGLMGLSPELIELFIKFLVNQRCIAMHIEMIYPEAPHKDKDNPLPWFNSFSSFNEQKTNFFEGTVTNYSKGSVDMDF